MARNPEGARSVLKRGQDALNTLKQEQDRAEARREASANSVYRFFIGKGPNGRGFAETEVVVLDDDATQSPFAHEHVIPGPGNNFSQAREHVCVDEIDNCVLCRAREAGLGDEYGFPSYGMYVTIGDLTEREIKNGPRAGQMIDYTRKLMVIPQGSVGEFMKMFELCKKQNGTTRGMVMVLTKQRKQDPRCGRPQMLENGMLFDFMEEDELEDYANDEVVRDGKVLKEAGADIEALDYDEILAPPDQKVLRKLYNLPAMAGSEEDEEESTGSNRRARRRGGARQDDAQDEQPPARRRRAAAQPDEEQEEAPARRRRAAAPPDDEQSDEAPPPRSRRAAAREEQSAPPRRRRAAAAQDEDEAPAARSRTRSRPAQDDEQAEAPARRRRAADYDDPIPF